MSENPAAVVASTNMFTLTAKYKKERIVFESLPPTTTLKEVKALIYERTNILPLRQKLIGLQTIKTAKTIINKKKRSLPTETSSSTCSSSSVAVARMHPESPENNNNNDNEEEDDADAFITLSDLKAPKNKKKNNLKKDDENPNMLYYEFILMGTPEEHILVDPPSNNNGDDEVINDFDFDFNAGSEGWLRHVVNSANLKKFTDSTDIYFMNQPRKGKPLLVLDLDHTLLDFSSKQIQQLGPSSDDTAAAIGGLQQQQSNTTTTTNSVIDSMKRPFMDKFLECAYKWFDLAVWSQTHRKWLEIKLIELGMINDRYKFCFVLDKASMFSVTSMTKTKKYVHQVKPLQIIWSKFPHLWSSKNTIAIDDLSRNFALNINNGLKVTAYYRSSKSKNKKTGSSSSKNKPSQDIELLALGLYLEKLAREAPNNFEAVDFNRWRDVVQGKSSLIQSTNNKEKETNSKK